MWITFSTVEGGTVHRLAHNPEDQGDGIFHGDVILVVLLQQALHCPAVSTNTRSLPTGVVFTRIIVVQLESIVWVVSRVKHGHAKWLKTYRGASENIGRQIVGQNLRPQLRSPSGATSIAPLARLTRTEIHQGQAGDLSSISSIFTHNQTIRETHKK
jgi:hypothetical protein